LSLRNRFEGPALKKRVCEHCRYFEPAGFQKSGWCTHPQRRQTNDLKLMVRANELPCRNGWSHDLFAAADEAETESSVAAYDDIFFERRPDEASQEVEPHVATRKSTSTGTVGNSSSTEVDIVVGEAPSMMGPPNRPSLIELQPRNAILKAREQYRARIAAETRGDEPAPLAPSGDTPIVQEPATGFILTSLDTWKHVPPVESRVRMPIRNEVPPVQVSELRNDFPQMVTLPGDDEVFTSVPAPVPGIKLPRPSQPAAPPSPGVAGLHDVPDHEFEATYEPVSNATTPADFTVERLTYVRDRESRGDAEQETAFDEEPFEEIEEPRFLPDRVAPPSHPRERRPLFGRRRREYIRQAAAMQRERVPDWEPLDWPEEEDDAVAAIAVEPVVEEPPVRVEPRPMPRVAAHAAPVVSAPAIREPELGTLPNVVAFDNEDDLEPIPVVARDPMIRRICETCRDFRPGEKNGRGRCVNHRAFAETAVVSPSTLACSSSFGDWWSQSDSFWLSDADISAHGQPTPLVDAWLARKVESATAKSDDGSARRRRKQS
jgi:hypothetical protein